jgi:hypothetical protein
VTIGGLEDVVAVAVTAAIPLAFVLAAGWGGSRPLSPGRHFVAYAVLFAALLLSTRWTGHVGGLSVLALVMGVLGTGPGVRAVYRWLYGPDWLRARPEVVRRDVARWQWPALVVAVLAFTLALAIAYLPAPGAGAR